MSVSRTLLRPVAFLAGWHASRQAAEFLRAHRRTKQVQDDLLAEMIRAHRRTAFGQDHGFSAIRSSDDFRRAVPVGSYLTLRSYVQRVLEGETTALLPPGEGVLMFSRTSGTTGKPKHIPVTRRFLADIRRGWNAWGIGALRNHKDAWLRKIVQIVSSMNEATSPTGLPCGAISGLLAATQKRIVRRMYPVPRAVAGITDGGAKYYTTLRCACGQDVAFITTANPSSTIKLAETAQVYTERLIRDVRDGTLRPPGEVPPEVARGLRFRPRPAVARAMEAGVRQDGALLPKHLWKLSFLANWTGGTLKLYLPRLRELYGHVPVRDIGLLASEGRFTIPLRDETASGAAEILGNFLEFIPAEHYADDEPPTLRAHEVEVGREYFLVVTNWAGLWRYSMDDRVLVTGWHEQSPELEFLSRGNHTANITGEKITEHQVVEAMRRASLATGVGVERFVVQGRFAETPYYEVRLEHPDGANLRDLGAAMEQALCELNIEYLSKRKSDRLGPVRPVVLPAGTLQRAEDECIRAHHGRGEQYKHTYLRTEILPHGESPLL